MQQLQSGQIHSFDASSIELTCELESRVLHGLWSFPDSLGQNGVQISARAFLTRGKKSGRSTGLESFRVAKVPEKDEPLEERAGTSWGHLLLP